jgi:hypothetical protein
MKITTQDVIQFATLVTICVALNEAILTCVHPRITGVVWAFLCLWILFDGVHVATQLTHTENELKRCKDRCDNMQIEIFNLLNLTLKNERLETSIHHVKRYITEHRRADTMPQLELPPGASLRGKSFSTMSDFSARSPGLASCKRSSSIPPMQTCVET